MYAPLMEVSTNVHTWVLGSFVLAIGAWEAAFAFVKWSHPGGSGFPPGLPLAILASIGAIALNVAAVRKKPSAVIILVALLSSGMAIVCLVYSVPHALFSGS